MPARTAMETIEDGASGGARNSRSCHGDAQRARPTPRERREPTKKAAKNGTLARSSDPVQHADAVPTLHRTIGAHTNPRATLAFFSSLHRGELPDSRATGSLHALSVTQKQAAAGWIMHDNRAAEPFVF
ncbi:hypothetical protein DBV15_11008 [Temnothorax longispinosus]|uniref:Uncharacterized protein n=1 Tax=Temnothorax longispinosus TaxID=300112 RepID=A0A4S2KU54_9HYME|nr:hypothetical protein DBV15_11008 [Temnothorax longispinosus]